MRTLLDIRDLHVHFGSAHILQGVTLQVGQQPLALVGRNGMGKTTLCQTIMGVVAQSSGSIHLNDVDISGLPPNRIAGYGAAWVPQGRRMFASLSVHEHLLLVSRGRDVPWTVERVYEFFPRLAERRKNCGNQLSGGEQQMVAIARALLMNPKLLIMDEPTEGLAPIIADQLVQMFGDIARQGIGILMVEQNIRVATAVAEQVAVMVTGQIVTMVAARDLAANEDMQRVLLGVSVESH